MRRIFLLLGMILALDPASAVRAEEKEVSIEDFLQGLSTVPGVVFRKDPFIEAQPPFEMPKVDGSSLSAPVMERYPVAAYSVVAVLLGEQYPRALLRLPSTESSKVVIVKLKDKLGNKGGAIARIEKDGITVVQNQRSPLGFVDKTEIKLPVGDGKVPGK